MTTYKCRANKPNECRFHGSIHIHRQELVAARSYYTELVRSKIRNNDEVGEEVEAQNRLLVQKAAEVFGDAQATLDAHNSNYKAITNEIKDIKYAGEGDDPADFTPESVSHLNLLEARKSAAGRVRRSRENEDNPHGLAYVLESPQDLTEAKAACKQCEVGEFTGVLAGEDNFKGEETLLVVGSEGYYKTTTSGVIYATGTLHRVNDHDGIQAPIVVSANRNLEGKNLRWKNDWKSTVKDGNRENEHIGYIVFSDTHEYRITNEGAVRRKSGLLSLQ